LQIKKGLDKVEETRSIYEKSIYKGRKVLYNESIALFFSYYSMYTYVNIYLQVPRDKL
jgi:hypothetical protein